jgi:hypothetical protein
MLTKKKNQHTLASLKFPSYLINTCGYLKYIQRRKFLVALIYSNILTKKICYHYLIVIFLLI